MNEVRQRFLEAVSAIDETWLHEPDSSQHP